MRFIRGGGIHSPAPERLRQADALSPTYQRKLGSDDGMGEPEKPNGMHWATYNRLLDRADELDDRGWMSALGGLLLSAG